MSGDGPLLRTRGLTKRYPEVTAVDSLDVDVPRGRVGLVGANGAGKTTLFRMMLGLSRPTAGSLEVCGVDVAHDPIAARRRLGFMPEHDCMPLDQALSGAQVVILAIPDTAIGKVAAAIAPQLAAGTMVMTLDAAAPFAGHLPDADLAAAVGAADAVVLPSRYEPFGIVALEAAAASAPLVVARTGGLAEIVVDGETGTSFPPGDVAAGAGAVWVTDELGDRLVEIDPTTNRITRRIPVGRGAGGVAVGAGSVWVAGAIGHTVTRVDPASGRVAATIRVAASPHALAVGDGAVWVVGDAR